MTPVLSFWQKNILTSFLRQWLIRSHRQTESIFIINIQNFNPLFFPLTDKIHKRRQIFSLSNFFTLTTPTLTNYWFIEFSLWFRSWGLIGEKVPFKEIQISQKWYQQIMILTLKGHAVFSNNISRYSIWE